MKSLLRSSTLLRNGFAPLLAVSLGLLLCKVALGASPPALTIDYSIGDLSTGSTQQPIVANHSYTVEVWAVITGSTTAADLGFEQAQFGADSSTTSTPAILGGTASTTGGSAGVGITAIGTTSTYLMSNSGLVVPATSGSIGDFTNDGINDISSSTSAATPKGLKATTLGINVETNGFEFGGTPTAGSEAFGGGWAFQIGTFTVTTGANIGAGGSTTVFTPVAPTYNNGGKLDYTVTGTTTATAITTGAVAVGQSVTFAVSGSAPTNSSVLNLSPTSLTFDLLQGAPAPATQNLSLAETTGTSGNNASYTGNSVSGFSINGGASGTVNAGTANTLAVGYTGSTAAPGTFSGTYTVSNTSGSSATQSNLSATLTAIVGTAIVDNSGKGTFGGSDMLAVIGTGPNGYAGLSSSASTTLGAQGGAGVEHSVATILMGTNSGGPDTGGNATVGMTWRNRMSTESPTNDGTANGNINGFVNGSPLSPPLNKLPLISDVVRLFGMNSNATATSTGLLPTDPFVLQMSFNPLTLKNEGATDTNMATRGNLYLASLMQLAGQATATWQNAILGDFAVPGGASATYNGASIPVGADTVAAMSNNMNRPFIGTFALWQSEFDSGDPTGANLHNFVGVYGVDPNSLGTNDYNAWAIINHNSDFAVVPEPSAIVLAAFGLLGGLCLIRRRKTLAAA